MSPKWRSLCLIISLAVDDCILLYWSSDAAVLWVCRWLFMNSLLMQTHSAYMLFYERMKVGETSSEAPIDISPPDTADGSSAICRLDADDDDRHKMKIELSPELAEVVILTLTFLTTDRLGFIHCCFHIDAWSLKIHVDDLVREKIKPHQNHFCGFVSGRKQKLVSQKFFKKLKTTREWYFTHLLGHPHWSNRFEFWRAGSYRWRNHLHQIFVTISYFGLLIPPSFAIFDRNSCSPLQQCMHCRAKLICLHLSRFINADH